MEPKLPKRDPINARKRKKTATRRMGANMACACGEERPEALIKKSNPKICLECKRKREGKTTLDRHHVAGAANSPETIPIRTNDHCAELNVAQQDWPKETLQNPSGSPFLAAAACIRGFVDTIVHLIKKTLLWIPEFLEYAHSVLEEKLGPKWWINTPLEKFVPSGKAR